MNCDEIKMMISDYIDNELQKEKEGYLFTHLAACGECREEFKEQNRIQNEVRINQKEVSEEFEKRVFNSIGEKRKTFAQRWITKPTPVYVNYVLGLVIIVITFFSFIQLNSLRYDLNVFRQRYEASIRQMNYQASQMYLMMNSMPAVEIKQY
ncbi:MAG: hypothetical protein CVV24_07750 [Ignavibacteriae bacterium HGW-Ignavibacteriae-3]|nr:MAG: hypothetical protein CVV24_07750 [Ignavibacteriae bacterium HGW-Ignavibacteriae-3]